MQHIILSTPELRIACHNLLASVTETLESAIRGMTCEATDCINCVKYCLQGAEPYVM